MSYRIRLKHNDTESVYGLWKYFKVIQIKLHILTIVEVLTGLVLQTSSKLVVEFSYL